MTTLLFAGNIYYPRGGMRDMLGIREAPAGFTDGDILDAVSAALLSDHLEHDEHLWAQTARVTEQGAPLAEVTHFRVLMVDETTLATVRFASHRMVHRTLGALALVPVGYLEEYGYHGWYATLDPAREMRPKLV